MYFSFPLQSQVGGYMFQYVVQYMFSFKNTLTSNADSNVILLTCVLCAPLILHLSFFLWVSGITSRLSIIFIQAIASQSTLRILVFTETRISSEDSATPSVLSNFSFSIHRLPGQLDTFLEEMDGLLSSFSGDGSPLVDFITFNQHCTTCVPQIPLPVTFSQNLNSLSPFHLSFVVSSSLPSPTHFSSLDLNTATDTLWSTLNLTSCQDKICLDRPVYTS